MTSVKLLLGRRDATRGDCRFLFLPGASKSSDDADTVSFSVFCFNRVEILVDVVHH
jgi:hypothetical protein